MISNDNPTRIAFRPVGGLIAAAASVLIGVGAGAFDVSVAAEPTVESQTVTEEAIDALDFSATVTAFDVVLADPLAFHEAGRTTPYEESINDIAAGHSTPRPTALDDKFADMETR